MTPAPDISNWTHHTMEQRRIQARLLELGVELATQIVSFVQSLRKEDLEKKPGIAEMLDWAAALSGLGINDITSDPEALQSSLVCLLKTQSDQFSIPALVSQKLANGNS